MRGSERKRAKDRGRERKREEGRGLERKEKEVKIYQNCQKMQQSTANLLGGVFGAKSLLQGIQV